MTDLVPHDGITGPDGERVLVRRSARRRRTVSITRRGGDLVVAIPATFSRRQEAQWVQKMVQRVRRAAPPARPDDEELAARARKLAERHFDGTLRPRSITWSARQQRSRWGSCTPSEGTIRISTRLRPMPGYVLDYVIVHELAHLIEGGHTPEFWSLVGRYPQTERARGFLDGVSHADQRGAEAPRDGEGEDAAGERSDDDHGATAGDRIDD